MVTGLIYSHGALRHWWCFCQFYDAEYVKKNDNNFHILLTLSTYYSSNFLFFPRLSMYNIIIFKAKLDRQINYTLFEKNKAYLRDLLAATGLVILNWIQIVDFAARVSLKFDGWPRKTIMHFFYTTSSFVHHFKSICGFKPELQSGNVQFGSKLSIFCPVWPWNLTNDLEKQQGTSFIPFLFHIKLCVSFQSHGWIQTGVTVRKRSIRVKISNFLSRVTLKFDRWHWKTTGRLF